MAAGMLKLFIVEVGEHEWVKITIGLVQLTTMEKGNISVCPKDFPLAASLSASCPRCLQYHVSTSALFAPIPVFQEPRNHHRSFQTTVALAWSKYHNFRVVMFMSQFSPSGQVPQYLSIFRHSDPRYSYNLSIAF